MTPSIITIIVLATISVLVVGLMVFAYVLILRSTRKLSANGFMDEEYAKEESHKEKKWVSVLVNTVSLVLSVALLSLCTLGMVYRAMGQQITVAGRTALVIASNSMEGCVSDEYEGILANQIADGKGVSSEQAAQEIQDSEFYVGDMLFFYTVEQNEPLNLYDVYGYRNKKGQIITHRLVGMQDGKYLFRGDNTPANDVAVNRSQILYRYGNEKIAAVGTIVLFFSSSFGIYSIFVFVAVFAMSDIAKHQYTKMKKERLAALGGMSHAS